MFHSLCSTRAGVLCICVYGRAEYLRGEKFYEEALQRLEK